VRANCDSTLTAIVTQNTPNNRGDCVIIVYKFSEVYTGHITEARPTLSTECAPVKCRMSRHSVRITTMYRLYAYVPLKTVNVSSYLSHDGISLPSSAEFILRYG
jgi:hypothetical protein